MKRLLTNFIGSILLSVVIVLTNIQAKAETITPAQKKAFELIIHDYLLENPEVIIQSMKVLQKREQKAQINKTKRLLKTNFNRIYKNPMTAYSGNAKGDVTLVEFFDYQCGYCKQVTSSIIKLIKKDPMLRVAWKELPVLGENSFIAATAAMASQKQDKYLEFHVALMNSRGKLNYQTIMQVAKRVGIDTKKLKKDMANPEIRIYLDETAKLAKSLSIKGTPGFIIGENIVPGAASYDQLKNFIEKTRHSKK